MAAGRRTRLKWGWISQRRRDPAEIVLKRNLADRYRQKMTGLGKRQKKRGRKLPGDGVGFGGSGLGVGGDDGSDKKIVRLKVDCTRRTVDGINPGKTQQQNAYKQIDKHGPTGEEDLFHFLSTSCIDFLLTHFGTRLSTGINTRFFGFYHYIKKKNKSPICFGRYLFRSKPPGNS